ncbi:MAG: hypothetical protein ACOZNI_33925 [Myxococcota bacterium]
MKIVRHAFAVGYACIVALFLISGLTLVAFAVLELWRGLDPGSEVAVRGRLNAVLESVGLLTIAVAALELGQTVLEEEILRVAHMSAPTRVRRFLSRFLVVIVVALSIESLVAVFQIAHDDPAGLPQAATPVIAAAALLAAWGVFIRLNRSAEELEPQAMERAQREDERVEG